MQHIYRAAKADDRCRRIAYLYSYILSRRVPHRALVIEAVHDGSRRLAQQITRRERAVRRLDRAQVDTVVRRRHEIVVAVVDLRVHREFLSRHDRRGGGNNVMIDRITRRYLDLEARRREHRRGIRDIYVPYAGRSTAAEERHPAGGEVGLRHLGAEIAQAECESAGRRRRENDMARVRVIQVAVVVHRLDEELEALARLCRTASLEGYPQFRRFVDDRRVDGIHDISCRHQRVVRVQHILETGGGGRIV